MRTNIVIDDSLMNQALRLTRLPTKTKVVEESLKLMIQLKRQLQIKKFKGKLKWSGNLDAQRRDR